MKSMKKSLVVAILILFAVASLFAAPSVASPAATVRLTKSTVISTSDLQAAVDSYTAQGYAVSPLEVLNALINDELINQGAARDGYVLTEDNKKELLASSKANVESQLGAALTDEDFASIVLNQTGLSIDEFKENLASQYIIQAYVVEKKADMFNSIAAPTAKEIDTFYRKNASEFVNPEAVRMAIVLMDKSDNEADNKKTLKSLEDVLAQIKSGKLTFEKAVKTYSQDATSKANGGEIGWMTIDNADYEATFGADFYDTAFDLDDGEIGDHVVDSPVGYMILKVLEHTEFKKLSLTDPISPTEPTTVTEYITNYLLSLKQEEMLGAAYNSLINDLKKDAKINILYKESN